MKINNIICRARCKTGETITGSLLRLGNRYYIIPLSFTNELLRSKHIDGFEVDKESVCRYTGFHDAELNDIFENDKVIHCTRLAGMTGVIKWDDTCGAFVFVTEKNGTFKTFRLSSYKEEEDVVSVRNLIIKEGE